MSMTLKATVAAVALAVSASAGAVGTGTLSNDPGMTGDGELFINIVRNTATPGTIVLDTNISANDLVSGAVTSWTTNAAQTAAVQSLLATSSLSDFVFDAGAIQNDGADANKYGLLLSNTTSTLVPPPVSSISTFAGYISKAQTWVDSVNQGPNAGVDGMLTVATSGNGDWTDGFNGWNGNGDTLGWTPNTDTGVANTLSLYRYHYDGTTFASLSDLMGTLSVDTATGVVSYQAGAVAPVPVPAAAWLFGSGLVGLVGVARRRKG